MVVVVFVITDVGNTDKNNAKKTCKNDEMRQPIDPFGITVSADQIKNLNEERN